MRFIYFFLTIICLIGVHLFISNDNAYAAEQVFSEYLDELMEQKMKEFNTPNAAVTVVHEGKVIFEKGYGFAELATEKTVDPETALFRIGSISKLFTWTAVMQLVEEGKLELDEDINNYLDFDIPEGPNNSGPITLTHLMTHTPGFEDYLDTIFHLKQEEMLSLEQYSKAHLPNRVFPAGEVAAYSNYGTALAGYIVERVSGVDFAKYIEQNIYRPLNMTYSSFQQPLPSELENNLVQSYRYVDGTFLAGDYEYMPAPAGGMSSSVLDMAKYMHTVLENDGKVLQPETMEEMQGQQFTQDDRLDGMTLGFMERTIQDKRLIMHAGSTMLYDSGLYLLPEEKVGLFITYSGADYRLHTEVIQELIQKYYPDDTVDNPASQVGMKERSQVFVGEYHANRKSFTTSEKLISLLNGTIQIKQDEEGYLLVTQMGNTNRFVEIEEGVYQNLYEAEQVDPYGEFSKIIFETNSNGITTLKTDGPMSYSKAPWYSTSGFTFLTLLSSLLAIIGATVSGMLLKLIRVIKKKKVVQSRLSLWIQRVVFLYGVFTIVFVFGLLVNSEPNPVYGLPKSSYEEPSSWMTVFDVIPYVFVLFSFVLVLLVSINWWKQGEKLLTKVYYTGFTVITLLLNWLFYYWNVL